MQGHPSLELFALDDVVAYEGTLSWSKGTSDTIIESVIPLVSFMSRLKFTLMERFLTSPLLVGMVKLALVLFKWSVALTFSIVSFSPKTKPEQMAAKRRINIPDFMYLSISTPLIG